MTSMAFFKVFIVGLVGCILHGSNHLISTHSVSNDELCEPSDPNGNDQDGCLICTHEQDDSCFNNGFYKQFAHRNDKKIMFYFSMFQPRQSCSLDILYRDVLLNKISVNSDSSYAEESAWIVSRVHGKRYKLERTLEPIKGNNASDTTNFLEEGPYSLGFRCGNRINYYYFDENHSMQRETNNCKMEAIFVQDEEDLTDELFQVQIDAGSSRRFQDCMDYHRDNRLKPIIECGFYTLSEELFVAGRPCHAIAAVPGTSTVFNITFNETASELIACMLGRPPEACGNVLVRNGSCPEMVGYQVQTGALRCSMHIERISPNNAYLNIDVPFLVAVNKDLKQTAAVPSSTKGWITLLSLSLVAILVAVSGCLLCYKQKAQRSTDLVALKEAFFGSRHYIKPDLFKGDALEGDEVAKFYEETMKIARLLPSFVKPSMVYPRSAIAIQFPLGSGAFGSVYRGLFQHGRSVYNVAIKSINHHNPEEEAHQKELKALYEEAKIMLEVGCYHDNIVNLQGVSADIHNQIVLKFFLILELCTFGNLKSYLIQYRRQFQASMTKDLSTNISQDEHCRIGLRRANSNELPEHNLSLLITWCYQIARGMSFLGEQKIYHGDLAARNILLTDQLCAKVSDFGLSQRLRNCGALSTDEQAKLLPFKWSALETLLQGSISIGCDIWSYGILLWETFSLGEDPYKGMTFKDVRSHLLSGARLILPSIIPQFLSQMILSCWDPNPTQRPEFDDFVHQIKCNISAASQQTNTDNEQKDKQNVIYMAKVSNEVQRDQYKTILQCNPMYMIESHLQDTDLEHQSEKSQMIRPKEFPVASSTRTASLVVMKKAKIEEHKYLELLATVEDKENCYLECDDGSVPNSSYVRMVKAT